MTEDKVVRLSERALDRLVAELVLGWVPQEQEYWVDQFDRPSRKERGLVWYPPSIKPGSRGGWSLDVPHFSTDLAAAWQVVEHFAQLAAHGSQPEQERAAAFAEAFQRLHLYQYSAPGAARKLCELALSVAGSGKEDGS